MARNKEQYFEIKRTLHELHLEDMSFNWNLYPPNFTESRDLHHRTRAIWPGKLYDQYGEHRRGPS